MKMKRDHIRQLKGAIDANSSKVPPLVEYEAAGMTAKRWRWDILWESKALQVGPLCQELYTYLDDSHIDTALRHITGTK